MSSITQSTVFEIDSATGNDGNAGGFDATIAGGVDYTQGAGQKTITFNGSTVTASNAGASATITLTGYTVLSGDVGNTLNITGGTLFNVGLFTIISVNTGTNTWTLNAAVTTGIGAAMVGVAGGALASPGEAAHWAGVTNAAANDAFLKYNATPYSMSSSSNVSGGRVIWNGHGFHGYNTNRTPCNNDTRPIIQSSANSMVLFTMGSGSRCWISGIEVQNNNSNTSVTAFSGNGVNFVFLYNWKVSGVKTGLINNATLCGVFNSTVINATDTQGAIVVAGSSIVADCTTINSYGGIQSGIGNYMSVAINCIVAGNNSQVSGFTGFEVLYNCISYGCTGSSNSAFGASCAIFLNCIAEGATNATGFGFLGSAQVNGGENMLLNCFGYNNTTQYDTAAQHFMQNTVASFTTLGASAFASAGTTTAADFTITVASGIRNTAIPSQFPGIASVTYVDPGAIQHQAIGTLSTAASACVSQP